jgi:hypothetical protein
VLVESLKKVGAYVGKRQTCMARAFQRLLAERAFIKPQLQVLCLHGTFLIDLREPTVILGCAGRIDQKVSAYVGKRQTCMARAFQRLPTE